MKNCVKCIIALLFFLMCFLALQGVTFAEEIVTYEYEAESGEISGPFTTVSYVAQASNKYVVKHLT